METARRAAHSIKGGAAMMGFETLSDMACRLEDLFKVLETKQKPVEPPLKNLLEAAVERLRQLIDLNLKGRSINEQWLDGTKQIFDELQQFKSNRIPENVVVDLLPEDGQIIIKAIFETEVEGYLQRLESLLTDPEQYCLAEEISIVALELGGLGEMLELPAFKSLCESVNQHLEANPEQAEGIGYLALQGWRRSQELLLIGQADKLPKQIDLSDLAELLVDVEIVDDFPKLQDKSLHPSVLTETLTEPTSSINDKNYQDSFSIEKLQEIFSKVEELIIEHKRLSIEQERFGLKLGQLRSSLIPFIAKAEKREVSGQASPFFSRRENVFQNGSFSYHEINHKNLDSNFETSDLDLESNGLQKNKEPNTPQNYKKTILVVDDDPLVHEFLSITLKKANYGIELAKDGLQALQKLNDKNYTLALLFAI